MGQATRRSTAVVGLATALSLLAVACGGDDDDGGGASSSGSESGGPSPIEELMGSDFFESYESTWQSSRREVEDAVAECMQGLGFEYVAAHRQATEDEGNASSDENASADPAGAPLSDADFVAEFGYGISTVGDGEGALPGNRRGPNVEIIAAMSDVERAAYDEALRGDWSEFDAIMINNQATDEDLLLGVPDDAGCYGQSAAEVLADQRQPDGAFRWLVDAGETIEERVDNHSTVIDALGDWSNCVADAGFPGFASPDEAVTHIRQRNEALFMDGGGADPQMLERLQDDELSLAAADADCQESAHLEQVRQEAQLEVEEDFVEENRAELEQYRDAVISGSE